jgi:hypothetical protein
MRRASEAYVMACVCVPTRMDCSASKAKRWEVSVASEEEERGR